MRLTRDRERHRRAQVTSTLAQRTALCSEAELRHHPQIVADGVMIDEPSVPNLVPVDVLNFKAVARRLDTDQLPPFTGS
jgi:hypothetical protein